MKEHIPKFRGTSRNEMWINATKEVHPKQEETGRPSKSRTERERTSMMEKMKKKNEGLGWDTGFHSEERSAGVVLKSAPLTI